MKTKQERVTALVAKVNNKPDAWRWGQAYFNYALEMFPTKTEPLRATDLDPFHNDDRIQDFISKVCE